MLPLTELGSRPSHPWNLYDVLILAISKAVFYKDWITMVGDRLFIRRKGQLECLYRHVVLTQ